MIFFVPHSNKWGTKKSEEIFLYADIVAKGQIGYAEYPWEELDELAWFRGFERLR